MNTEQSKEEKNAKALNIGSVGKRISLTDLQVNDLFYMTYGFDKVKFRVTATFENEGILAHSLEWMKLNAILIPFSESRQIYYAGRMSKIRSWFLP